MINSAPKRKELFFLIVISLISILNAEMKVVPAFRIGYLGTSSSTTYGASLQEEMNVMYSTNGFEIEAGILHSWFSTNGMFTYSQRNSFPEKGTEGRKQTAPGKPLISGGGLSAYLERLRLPLKNAEIILKICPGIMVGYWIDKKSKWNRTLSEYENFVETRHFAGLLRIEGGYGIISGYGKIGLFDTSDPLLGAGITMILRRKY
ncbi:MAG: hypothetical protein GF401_06965 [Chitinivibrionales bacterium]|nr:hypothetical protein [Chitinivibrionales bacterium]